MGEVGSLRRLDADAGLAPVPPLRVVPGGESSVSLGPVGFVPYPSTASFDPRIPSGDGVSLGLLHLLTGSSLGWVRTG